MGNYRLPDTADLCSDGIESIRGKNLFDDGGYDQIKENTGQPEVD